MQLDAERRLEWERMAQRLALKGTATVFERDLMLRAQCRHWELPAVCPRVRQTKDDVVQAIVEPAVTTGESWERWQNKPSLLGAGVGNGRGYSVWRGAVWAVPRLLEVLLGFMLAVEEAAMWCDICAP